MRRRLPWWVLALLFVVVPIAELAILIQLGQLVGPWWTILILLADAALGSWLVKREGRRAWRALQDALAEHRMPAAELADGALILVGGTLLITPGFLSDVAGLFCILPVTRPLARRLLSRVITRRLSTIEFGGGPVGYPPGAGRPRNGASRAGSGYAGPGYTGPGYTGPGNAGPGHTEVIQGEVVED